MEELLEQAQLAIATHERRLETLRLERAAGTRDDTERTPERHEPRLPLELGLPALS